jgi:DNA-binding MarR family transcriptional regulator
MAAAVAALVRRDLVQVEGDPHDGRRNLLHLTQAGLDAAFAMENAEAKVIEVMLDGVAARDLKAAMSAMLTMLANLDPTRAERTGDAPDAHWAAREAAE